MSPLWELYGPTEFLPCIGRGAGQKERARFRREPPLSLLGLLRKVEVEPTLHPMISRGHVKGMRIPQQNAA